MTLLKSFKKLIIDKIIGIFFIILSIFSLSSLITHNVQDPGFGVLGNSNNIDNLMGAIGAYYSSFTLVLIGQSSYLVSLFFFIFGIKKIISRSKNIILLKFFILFVGLIGINLSITMSGIKFSLLGDLSLEIITPVLKNYFYTQYLYWFLVFILYLMSLILIYFALDFKYKAFNLIIKNLFLLITGIFKPLKKVSLNLSNFKKRDLSKTIVTKKSRNKLEPTIQKNKINRISNNLNKTKLSHDNLNEFEIKYILPPISLLRTSVEKKFSMKEIEKRNTALSKKLELTLQEYGVEGKVTSFKSGPVVTLFEFIPAAGVKSSKIVGLSDDIARAMSSISTRIAAQPGKTSLGIEIPNQVREGVLLGDIISNSDFFKNENGLTLALGKNISGEKKFTDLEKMPHLLIAGTTGSGKSVGINSMIISLLFRFTPSECKLILIDPKMLELSIYADIPHLLTPVVTNPNKAVFALKWVVKEMENRYRLMSSVNVKNISSFNDKILRTKTGGKKLYREVQTGIDRDTRKPIIEKKEIPLDKMPLIVVVIDEMADLMMVAGKEVENLVQRLAQMARASGIHIIAATQRPSVDVITGTIKANFPSRISFRVASRFDSRTILNEMGAEQLLGSGDMLFLENGAYLNRLHGGFVSESEIESVVNHIKAQTSSGVQQDITIENTLEDSQKLDLGLEDKNIDELYEKALQIILDQQKVSTSFIQRYLQIGYNRAARIVEKMEEDGYITEPSHSGKRSVIKKNK